MWSVLQLIEQEFLITYKIGKNLFLVIYKKLRIILNEMSFYCTIKQWALIWNMFCWNYFKVSHLFDKMFPQTVIYVLLLYSGTKKYPSVAIDNG